MDVLSQNAGKATGEGREPLIPNRQLRAVRAEWRAPGDPDLGRVWTLDRWTASELKRALFSGFAWCMKRSRTLSMGCALQPLAGRLRQA